MGNLHAHSHPHAYQYTQAHTHHLGWSQLTGLYFQNNFTTMAALDIGDMSVGVVYKKKKLQALEVRRLQRTFVLFCGSFTEPRNLDTGEATVFFI